jgi:DUF218 domain
LFLVTSGFHLRRSELYFRRLGVPSKPVPADHVDAMPGIIPVAYNFELADLALHEYIGVLRYYVYERMGWNARAEGGRVASGWGSFRFITGTLAAMNGVVFTQRGEVQC